MKAYYVANIEKHTQCNVRQFSHFFHTSLRIATENCDKILFPKRIIIVMPVVKHHLNFLQFLKHLAIFFKLTINIMESKKSGVQAASNTDTHKGSRQQTSVTTNVHAHIAFCGVIFRTRHFRRKCMTPSSWSFWLVNLSQLMFSFIPLQSFS